MSSSTPSTPKIAIPLVFSAIALILSVVVMSTPGLYRLSVLQTNGLTLQEIQTGPFHGCYMTYGMSKQCFNIDSHCKGKLENFNSDIDAVRASPSCAELNWMRAFLMITFFLGTISILLAALTKFSQRISLKPAIVLSLITGITSLITIGITIALFVGEVNWITDYSNNTDVAFTYGSTLLIINIVLYFCSTIGYIRAKRLHTLNDLLQQPMLATTTTTIIPSYTAVPVYTTAVPVYQQQQQQQGTYAYPVQQQQPQQQQYYPVEGQQYGTRGAPQQL